MEAIIPSAKPPILFTTEEQNANENEKFEDKERCYDDTDCNNFEDVIWN